MTYNRNRYANEGDTPEFLLDLRDDLDAFNGVLIGYSFSVFADDLVLLRAMKEESTDDPLPVPASVVLFGEAAVLFVLECRKKDLVRMILAALPDINGAVFMIGRLTK